MAYIYCAFDNYIFIIKYYNESNWRILITLWAPVSRIHKIFHLPILVCTLYLCKQAVWTFVSRLKALI